MKTETQSQFASAGPGRQPGWGEPGASDAAIGITLPSRATFLRCVNASPGAEPKPLPVSVAIVSRDEEPHLKRCLASVRGWPTEIIVAVESEHAPSAGLAREYGARVAVIRWEGHTRSKNAVLQSAQEPWVLCLDADEETTPSFWAGMQSFFARDDVAAFAGARCRFSIWFINRWIFRGDRRRAYQLRLIRKDAGEWRDQPNGHEKLIGSGKAAEISGVINHHFFPTIAWTVERLASTARGALVPESLGADKFNPWLAVGSPCWRFFRAFVLRGGFRDGFPGFYLACHSAFSGLLQQTRRYEKNHGRRPPVLSL
jgi:glycosyltransferase involved in cell wall biosynthesis